MAERTTWTDERIDDAVASLQRTETLLHEEMGGLRREMRQMRQDIGEEMRQMRQDMSQDMRQLRSDFAALHREIARIGWALSIGLLAALIALVAAST